MPAVDDRDEQPRTLGSHDRKGGSGNVDGSEEGGLDLGPKVLGSDLLEEPSVEVPGVVDHHVEAAKPVDGVLDGDPSLYWIGHIQGQRK